MPRRIPKREVVRILRHFQDATKQRDMKVTPTFVRELDTADLCIGAPSGDDRSTYGIDVSDAAREWELERFCEGIAHELLHPILEPLRDALDSLEGCVPVEAFAAAKKTHDRAEDVVGWKLASIIAALKPYRQ